MWTSARIRMSVARVRRVKTLLAHSSVCATRALLPTPMEPVVLVSFLLLFVPSLLG